MNVGAEVRIKDKATGEKLRGVVIDIRAETAMLDVTSSGLLGGPVDSYRRFVPGPVTRTIVIEVTE